jgi:hypothetical protein
MDAWWRWPGTLGLVAGEWTKYVFARVRIGLADLVSSAAAPSPGTDQEQKN